MFPAMSRFVAMPVLLTALLFPLTSAVAQSLPSVITATITTQPDGVSRTYLGRLEAVQAVNVTSRTEGFIARRAFEEGQFVNAGDVLYEIEPALHQAAVAQAKARLDSANATARHAQTHLNRIQRLGDARTVSQSDVDAALAGRDTARAAVAQAQAALKTQELQLSYTGITAPISGRIGVSHFHTGSLVNPASGALTEIVQLDPVRVVISVNERDVLSASHSSGTLEDAFSANNMTLSLRLSDGSPYMNAPVLESLGNRIDAQTGTLPVRMNVANPDHRLLPGGTVNVTAEPRSGHSLPVLPAQALQQNAAGHFVLLVNAEQRVQARPVRLGAQTGHGYFVIEGLRGGEKVVTEGLQWVRPGMAVNTREATDDPGLTTKKR
ncbi:putative RND efflux membrane fusion protein [Rahnella aquatilis CIP 78.65 = ATCC 33071]|uniref:RND family efflux transporter, MFP subunit n=1 Tax=Rahnella aquatilis (strain ATCC 33071 / DSM 4594 / JCM 1683 / NBRC 105701 / NCIMB 13365 / CIP 78.65) TaxID=745277 RepID=H2IUW3_RAHAC|nr:efflux RND transporter periplasmic adaptor subunit [Rahnella aquatilis]AEX52819.1 RND family efflux transporter, MFP subunit [Rahnella aquatilis CIP 78.65 = ATCC 33071]KFD05374.1 putative RND efflux membrane fusion protein [Rahnella aquatilis CIP 78.65 = ATCC 33071]